MKAYHSTLVMLLVSITNAGAQNAANRHSIGLAGDRVKTSSATRYVHSQMRAGGGAVNDECTGAITVEPGIQCVVMAATYEGATQSLEPNTCSGWLASVANDVWFSFVATGPISVIRVHGGVDNDPVLEAFSGTCGSLTSVSCIDQTLIGGLEQLSIQTTPGETYHYRTYYWPYGEPPEDHSFTTCVITLDAPPANDLCENATVHVLEPGGMVTLTGSSLGALDTEELGLPTVWEAFTLSTCADVHFSYCGTPLDHNLASGSLFKTCPASMDQRYRLACIDLETCTDGQNSVLFWSLIPGTYYLPVFGGAEEYTITLTAAPCTPVPNNDCSGALVLQPSPVCEPIQASGTHATSSGPADACGPFLGEADDDVWFQFTATSPEMAVRIHGSDGYDAVVFVFEGACGTLSEIGCSDVTGLDEEEIVQLTDLVIGATYHVRVYNYFVASMDCVLNFTICVTGAEPHSVAAHSFMDLNVFPNPGDGRFMISNGSLEGLVRTEVLDLGGRVVHDEWVRMIGGGSYQLDLRGRVAAGSYVLRLSSNGHTHSRQLNVQ